MSQRKNHKVKLRQDLSSDFEASTKFITIEKLKYETKNGRNEHR
jgi:hypothetical protein